MASSDLPIVITTPFIGQGGITNTEWIKARMALFEMITFPSVSKIMDEQIFWGIYLGDNPDQYVEDWAKKIFQSNRNISLIKKQWNSENIVSFSSEVVNYENYITTAIADDDALNINFFNQCRAKGDEFISRDFLHVGGSFANGLMWLMSDSVDIDQVNADRFLVRKPVLVKYLFPWIGLGQFVLQTKSKPFRAMATTHMQFPEVLAKEGFRVEVFSSPERAWLYNRHQLADSSLLKCNSRPIPFTNEQLETEFGIDSKKLLSWSTGPHGKIHCQKRLIERRDRNLMSLRISQCSLVSLIILSFSNLVGSLSGRMFSHNIRGRCRIRIYDENQEEYFLLLSLSDSRKNDDFVFPKTIFPGTKYRYDIQKWNGERWEKSLPAISMMFSDYDEGLESLKTIKRMNDIFYDRIDGVGRAKVEGNLTTNETIQDLQKYRTYTSRDGIWDISVQKEKLQVEQDDDSENDFIHLSKISLTRLTKVRVRITSLEDNQYSLELIFQSLVDTNPQFHSSLIPPIEFAMIDLRSWDGDKWVKYIQKTSLSSLTK